MKEKQSNETTLCAPSDILIFPCSGGCNVGQIANDAAKDLTSLKKGKMYCLAGIGGHISGLLEATKTAKKIVAIDGCPVQCTRNTLEHAGFSVDIHVIVTELGIDKRFDFMMDIEEINAVINKVSNEGLF